MSTVNESELTLGNGTYVSQSPQVSDQRYKNWFPNYPETQAISKAQAFPTPGLTSILTTGGSASTNRGAFVMDGKPFFVNGSTLWRIDRSVSLNNVETFSEVNLGTIAGTSRVSMDTNGTQLCIVVPGTATAYIYTTSGGLVQITDGDFIPSVATIVNQVKFVSGYFVFAADNAVVFHSAVNDGLNYNALDFFVYENARNDVVGIHEYKDQLYVFSTVSSAGYSATNISSLGSAFVAITGYTFSKGLAARFTIFDFDGSFVMIGKGENESAKVYIFTGNDFEEISHKGIEFSLQGYSDDDIANSFGFNYTTSEAIFAVFSLPNDTLVFDSKASKLSGQIIWHERQSENLIDKSRWRPNSLVTAYSRLMVGDSDSGIIGFVDDDADTDYGTTIIREIGLSTIENNSKTQFHAYLEVVLASGETTGDGEPQIGMSYSSDARNATPTRYRGCGKKGEYNKKVRWYNLGSTNRLRNYTLTTTAKLTLWKVLAVIDG